MVNFCILLLSSIRILLRQDQFNVLILDHEGLLDLKDKVVKLENEQTEVIPENIRGII